MWRKNNGSILIIALIVFSIISTICMACIGLAYTNINIYSLENKNLQLKENALSGIEIVYANMKKEVYNAIDYCNSSSEFINYIKKDNYKNFINNVKSISNSNLNNLYIELNNKTNPEETNKLEFILLVKSNEGNYKKNVQVNIQIKNPWSEAKLEEYYLDKDSKENNYVQNKENLEGNEVLNEDNIGEQDGNMINNNDLDKNNNNDLHEIDLKEDLKKQKLITIYNYGEL